LSNQKVAYEEYEPVPGKKQLYGCVSRNLGSRRIAQACHMEVSPPELKIAGPESRVQLVDSVPTDAIDLSGSVGQTDFRVSAYVSDAQVRFEGATTVAVRVILEKIPARQD